MNREIVIRKAIQDDLDSIYEINKNSFTLPWSKEALKADINEHDYAIVFVAEYRGKIVGYADIWTIAGEADLNSIAVNNDFHRLGIGNALTSTMIKTLDSMVTESINLEVRVSNTPAINLYKKYGFRECGIRPNYYLDNGEDALIMKREKK